MKTKVNFKQSLIAGLLAASGASVVNIILFYTFKAAGVIVDSIFIQPDTPLTVVPIIISSVIPTIIASLVFFVLEKYTKNGFKIFRILSIILLLLSFTNPFLGIPNVTISYGIALNLMHIVVVLFLLFFIGKKTKETNI